MTDRSDDEVAARLATEAGELLLGVREELADASAAERKDAGDKRSHEFLMEALASVRPDDAVLSEEGVDNPIRLTAERVWIVDPLDGTREFSELGRDDWAVHVALWQAGELVAGAVALPAQGVTLATPERRHRRLPRRPSRESSCRAPGRPPSRSQSATRWTARSSKWARREPKSHRWCRASADVYVHAGGQYEWDSAAPVAVARAAGLHTSRIDGSPLDYNRADPLLPDLIVCRPELAEAVLSVTR